MPWRYVCGTDSVPDDCVMPQDGEGNQRICQLARASFLCCMPFKQAQYSHKLYTRYISAFLSLIRKLMQLSTFSA